MKNFLVILLVAVGVGVGIVSLYMASLSGVMSKMGLVGGDFRESININELARLIMVQKGVADCGMLRTIQTIPGYFYSQNEERVTMSRELGGVRIICGVRQVQGGNVERGVYTILKGLYYLREHYGELRILVEKDRNRCELLQAPDYERWIEGYLMAASGRAYDLVLDVYKQVQVGRAGVEELCSD